MWYDLLTLVILMYAMFRGAMKGIVWQLATIAALLMCFFFSGSMSAAVAPFIRVEPPLNQWIAMLILYLGFSFVSFGVARALHEMIESMRIEALDRHLGAILGLVKGGMFSLFLTFFLVTLSHSGFVNRSSTRKADTWRRSLSIGWTHVIPGDLHAFAADPTSDDSTRRKSNASTAKIGSPVMGGATTLAIRSIAGKLPMTGTTSTGIASTKSSRSRWKSEQNRVDRDRPDADRDLRDRTRRPLQADRRDLDKRRPLDDDRDGKAGLDRDPHRSGDDRRDIALDRDGLNRDGLNRDGLNRDGLNRDGAPRPAEFNRDRRTGDDSYSAADADRPVRRRDRRRYDDRPGLTPASDSTDDLAATDRGKKTTGSPRCRL